MKLNPGLAKSLLMAASIGMVVPILAQSPAPAKSGKASAPAPKSPARRETPAAEETKPEEAPAIKGVEVARPEGRGFLGIELEDGKFKLSFYDAEKKPMKPDVARAVVRWNPVNKIKDERIVLNPTEGDVLRGAQFVQAPHVFNPFFLVLLDDKGETVESHRLNLKF